MYTRASTLVGHFTKSLASTPLDRAQVAGGVQQNAVLVVHYNEDVRPRRPERIERLEVHHRRFGRRVREPVQSGVVLEQLRVVAAAIVLELQAEASAEHMHELAALHARRAGAVLEAVEHRPALPVKVAS
jgi:hypothetical protein